MLLKKTSKAMHLEKTCEYNIQLTEEKSRAWRVNRMQTDFELNREACPVDETYFISNQSNA
jgi:hypothetical protein